MDKQLFKLTKEKSEYAAFYWPGMLNIDRIYIIKFIYFYEKLLSFELLKNKSCYNLQSKMSWHSDFKTFTDELFPL